MHNTKRMKPVRKDYILYDSNCMIFWKKKNCGAFKKISDCHGARGMANRRITEEF